MGLLSRPRAPADVRALVAKGERLMAWGTGPERLDGSATLVVTTDQTLYAPGYCEPTPWECVMRASFDDPILEIIATYEQGTPLKPILITLTAAGSVPAVVRERVGATIVLQRHVPLVDDRGVQLVARRVRGTDEIRWTVVFDSGLDPADPDLRELGDQALQQLRDSVGI